MGLFRRNTEPEPSGQQRRAKANREASRLGEQAFVRREQERDRAAYTQTPARRPWWR
jgi:hypothetical protein